MGARDDNNNVFLMTIFRISGPEVVLVSNRQTR
jgi:hypothetical protein